MSDNQEDRDFFREIRERSGSTMKTWLGVDHEGNNEHFSALTETEAKEKAFDSFGGNLRIFEEIY